MTARGINDALASLDLTVRSRTLRYRRSCLLSEVAWNPVVYHPISECLRHGLKTYLPFDTFYTSAPHSYTGLCWTLALRKPLQPVEELISVPFFPWVFLRVFHAARLLEISRRWLGKAWLPQVQARRKILVLKQVNGTLVPSVGVLLQDSPCCDSQSDGKQLTADWPCRVALPGYRPRFALRSEKITAAPQ